MNNPKTIRMTMLAAAMTAACAWATAQEITLYESHVLPEGLIFEPVDAMGMQASIDMIIKGPEDFHLRKSFKAGEPIEFSPATLGHGEMPDGTYRYELQIMGISGMTTDRDSGKPAITESLTGGYGAFSIRDGNLVSPGVEEASYKGETAPVGTLASSVQSPASQDGSDTRDQVIADDLIVTSSICVGFDCVNGESFGFDTLRLKENNLRIKFDDTSNSGSFPSNDWQLTANDSANGGANKFSIDDITGGRTPFTIEASAPSHSLYVDDGGRIGFGTSTPVVENHIVDGDSPTIRLQQDGSSGFTAQTFDIAANEANFFVRDVTNGSQLPFRIKPGADTDSLFIAANNNIGVGTDSPDAALHVEGDVYANGGLGVGVSAPGTPVDVLTDEAVIMRLRNTGNAAARFSIVNGQSATTWTFDNLGDSFRITQSGGPAVAFRVFSGGNATFGGDVTANGVLLTSSREKKTDFKQIDNDSILNELTQLEVSEWRYKHDSYDKRHIGPFAEEFRDRFGLGDGKHISAVDLDGVSLAAIKALANRNKHLEQDNSEIRAELDDLRRMISELKKKM